jgi:hypothetical protein
MTQSLRREIAVPICNATVDCGESETTLIRRSDLWRARFTATTSGSSRRKLEMPRGFSRRTKTKGPGKLPGPSGF